MVVKSICKEAVNEDIVVEKKPIYDNKIVLSNSKSSIIVNLSDVEYIESNGCYSHFHLSNDKRVIISSKPLMYYQSILVSHNFLRVHNKYLVNVEHIKEILSGKNLQIVLSSKDVLPVSKFKKSDLTKMFLY